MPTTSELSCQICKNLADPWTSWLATALVFLHYLENKETQSFIFLTEML